MTWWLATLQLRGVSQFSSLRLPSLLNALANALSSMTRDVQSLLWICQ